MLVWFRGLVEVILDEPYLVRSFPHWETEAPVVRQRTELEGSMALKLETLMSLLGRLVLAALWSGTWCCVLLSPLWAFPGCFTGVDMGEAWGQL